jgi:hypothetical protein
MEKTFKEYLKLYEELSDEDIKKIKEVGIATAKVVFKDDFDEDKANEVIDGIIEKNKDKNAEDISGILKNTFTS